MQIHSVQSNQAFKGIFVMSENPVKFVKYIPFKDDNRNDQKDEIKLMNEKIRNSHERYKVQSAISDLKPLPITRKEFVEHYDEFYKVKKVDDNFNDFRDYDSFSKLTVTPRYIEEKDIRRIAKAVRNDIDDNCL